MSKYEHKPIDWFEAIVDKLGGEAQAEKLLSGELTVSELWVERRSVIYFPVTSDGTTGDGWIKRLEGKGHRVVDRAKFLLRSEEFKPTSGVTTQIAIFKGVYFEDSGRITNLIRDEMRFSGFKSPNAEIGCLIREKFTNKEIEAMGISWLMVMHTPIKDSDGDPSLLSFIERDHDYLLSSCEGNLDKWHPDSYGGFAFTTSTDP